MKTSLTVRLAGIIILSALIIPIKGLCQKELATSLLKELPKNLKFNEKKVAKYSITADYFNKSIYGDFMNKLRVTGDYMRDMKKNTMKWSNVTISNSNSKLETFPAGVKQDYMENMEYTPSPAMLQESFFKNFPNNQESIFSRNLAWDMMAIEEFAWNYLDSLRLNKSYKIPDIKGQFAMANIGNYNHTSVYLSWVGISMMNNELCAIIEYRALDNKLELSTNEIKSKGIELYWGKTWVSLKDKSIEYSEMYSNTTQELEIKGMPNKMVINTIREIRVVKTN